MKVGLRAATASDSRLFHDFVNRPDSLANKRVTKGPIPWEEHQAWFVRCMDDPECRMWVVTGDDEPIGQVRMTRDLEGWEVDIYVVEQHRGGGLACTAIGQAIAALRKDVNDAVVVARVMLHNRASCRLFESAGFRLARRESDHLVYMN
jgi:UDP-2,4-diacetamido-2,4,6-trideoxy-beta-L-altropyranose hydrolase